MMLVLLTASLALAQELTYERVAALHTDSAVQLPPGSVHVTGGWCTDFQEAGIGDNLEVHCYWFDQHVILVSGALSRAMSAAGYAVREEEMLPNGLTATQTWMGTGPAQQPLIGFTIQPLPWDVNTTMLVTLAPR